MLEQGNPSVQRCIDNSVIEQEREIPHYVLNHNDDDERVEREEKLPCSFLMVFFEMLKCLKFPLSF